MSDGDKRKLKLDPAHAAKGLPILVALLALLGLWLLVSGGLRMRDEARLASLQGVRDTAVGETRGNLQGEQRKLMARLASAPVQAALKAGDRAAAARAVATGWADVKRSAPKSTTADQSKPKPKYDFYTLLPESEVIVPPDAMPEPPAPAEPEQKPVTPEEAAKIDAQRAEAALAGLTPPPPPLVASAAQTQYFLQAGSFRKATDADRVRAQIILLGQSVQVESGTVR